MEKLKQVGPTFPCLLAKAPAGRNWPVVFRADRKEHWAQEQLHVPKAIHRYQRVEHLEYLTSFLLARVSQGVWEERSPVRQTATHTLVQIFASRFRITKVERPARRAHQQQKHQFEYRHYTLVFFGFSSTFQETLLLDVSYHQVYFVQICIFKMSPVTLQSRPVLYLGVGQPSYRLQFLKLHSSTLKTLLFSFSLILHPQRQALKQLQ